MRVVLTVIISTICLSLIAQDVKVGNQVWMSKNLNTSQFNDGTTILEVTNIEDWMKCATNKTPAYCYPSFDSNNNSYGKLYNYYAVVDKRGLAPIGWKIPSLEDFFELKSVIKYWGDKRCGNHLKSVDGWVAEPQYYQPIVNSYGFNAYPSGSVILEIGANDLKLKLTNIRPVGIETRFWTTTEGISQKEYGESFLLMNISGSFSRSDHHRGSAFSVRCLKDNSYVNESYKEKTDTLVFERGFCYHEIESCQAIFVKSNGETVEFQGAYYQLGDYADENWETGSIKEEYKGKKFIVRYKLVDISEQNSFMGEAYSKNEIIEIKLIN